MDIELKIVVHLKRNISVEQEEKGIFDLPEESTIKNKLDVLKSMPNDILSVFFDVDVNDVSQVNWDNIYRTLREEVLVKYEPGKGLIDDSEDYDKQWFSKIKITDKFDKYYSSRFSDCYKDKLGPQVLYTLSRDTESILNLCGSPRREKVKHVRGLVFGYVQSGKTLNYASVTNAAMGSGYDMIIVLAGSTNILREQTQNRLNHDLIGQYNGKTIGVGIYNNVPAKKPISLTSPDGDFNTKEANAQTNGINLENIRVPVVAVIKKHVTPLKNLKEWLNKQAGQGGVLKKSLLLIDDESDYASVNTKEEEDPTAINKGIRDLLNSFDVSTYLAVTATPFANILIDHEVSNDEYGADLFPRSFIWALDKPETYVGVGETLGDCFVDIDSLVPKGKQVKIKAELNSVLSAKKNYKHKTLPSFIKYGVCRFLYDSVCLRNERPNTDHLSMLVNISRFTDHHIQISALIQTFTNKLFNHIKNRSLERIEYIWLIHIKELAEENINGFSSLKEFWKELEILLGITEIYDIHQLSKVPLSYPDGMKRNSILVGGLSLSRGFTIEGLITTVFLRTTKTFDALMQMGRWFGHKKHILKFISVYSSLTIRKRFELIEDSIVDLLHQIDEMKMLKLSPRDFGLKIRLHPNVVIELEVVSKAKSRSAQVITLRLPLGNRIMETVRFLNDEIAANYNAKLVHNFFEDINKLKGGNKYSPVEYPSLYVDIENRDSILGFIDVPNDIVKEFLINFKLPIQKLSDTNSKLPLRFLLEYLGKKENDILKWDISLVSGGQSDEVEVLGKGYHKVKRSMEKAIDGQSIKLPKNQLSIPSHEYRFLTNVPDETKNRSEARGLRKTQTGKPLLLIFPILPMPAEGTQLDLTIFNDVDLWGWSISMPGGIRNEDEHVSVLANSVYINEFNELMQDYEDILEDEDN